MAVSVHATKSVEYQTTVVDVLDGKTIVISNKVFDTGIEILSKETIELDGIDSPEMDQPGGKESHDFLKSTVKGQRVKIIELTDCGRSQGGWVFHKAQTNSVNLVMIEKGLAWSKKQQITSVVPLEKMKKTQEEAKEAKKGLWSLDNPVPPWEWREKKIKEKQ
jgi:endonuclease YncB( thermonuclease family)